MPFIDARRCVLMAAIAAALTGCARPLVEARPLPAPARPPSAERRVPLPPAVRVGSWPEYRLQAAHRLVAANPSHAYMGAVPEPLLAIPVLEVHLNADGTVRRIRVLRYPTQALDTVQIAIEAVQRAAPFGDVSRLPKPWTFAEVFPFDDGRRFEPRSLDVD